MAVKTILKMGDPRLLERASPVTRFDTLELHALLVDMRDTIDILKGAGGIAAPQIGVGLQVVIFGFENPRNPDAEVVPDTVLINPTWTPLGDEMTEDWEGCLSVRGGPGWVPRYTMVRYQGFDQFGTAIDRSVCGFHARLVQHECDHLIGVLYPTRICATRRFEAALVHLTNSVNESETWL